MNQETISCIPGKLSLHDTSRQESPYLVAPEQRQSNETHSLDYAPPAVQPYNGEKTFRFQLQGKNKLHKLK
jgi:hypothetical protein